MFIRGKSLQGACDQDGQFFEKEVMWQAAVITLSASRGQKQDHWGKVARRQVSGLGVDLELLIKGCLSKKHFLFPVVFGLGWVLSCGGHGNKDPALGGRAGQKPLALYQPYDFLSPGHHTAST